MVVAFDRREHRDLLTINQAAAEAGVSPGVVRAWCASGRLPSSCARRGKPRRVRRSDLARLVRARRLGPTSPAAVRDPVSGGGAAMRRIAAEASGPVELDGLFAEVVTDSLALFSVGRVGLWQYDAGRQRPFSLAAQHGLSDEVVGWISLLQRDANAASLSAIHGREVVVLRDAIDETTTPVLREMYVRHGIGSACFAPIIYRGEPLGLLVLYHDEVRDWSTEELALARGFADQLAIAIGNARLFDSVQSLAGRLQAIHELAHRLNRTRDLAAIAEVIVEGTQRLIPNDSVRVYRVDADAGTCEAIAFRGTFGGRTDPDLASLRVAIGEGLTGWAAEHNETLLVGDARHDPRALTVHAVAEAESMLVAPMSYEDRVHGVIVVAAAGADRYGEDDETTLTIFAGYAAQAMVNAEHLAQLDRQRAELEHQLATQRRLLEVNERLLSTRDPKGVLELIADSLKQLVPYDSLTIYRCDFAAGVRRAVVARDRFADVILDYAGPIGVGITGWVVDHAEAVLANDAHVDPRSVQIPGTPYEPESMLVVPLRVAGEVIGTLNVGRMGEAEAHFTANEFELCKLFAGQASVALENAEAHGAVAVQAEHDALTGLRNHGSFQRELLHAVNEADGGPFAVLMLDLDAFKAFNDTFGHPAGDALLTAIAGAIRSATREGDALYRYGGDEFAVLLPGANRVEAFEVAERIRHAVALLPSRGGPPIRVTAGVACYPNDGTGKDELVAAADQSLYLAKPSSRAVAGDDDRGDPYLVALDETAIALMHRRDPDDLLETIISRAAALVGTPHGYIYLLEPDGESLVVRHGIGLFEDFLGYRLAVGDGLAGRVCRDGQPIAVADYDTWSGRATGMPERAYGAVVGVPLTSGSQVVGVIGLAAGSLERAFGPREISALTRFAQLASIALDNAHLFEAAQRGALYDPVTGLPNRDLLTDRVSHSLSWNRDGDQDPIALILLDLARFKTVNESLGHSVGDRLLGAVGERLGRCLRPGDTVARFGGDEFGVILDGIPGVEEARRITDRMLEELRAPFQLGGRDWYVDTSLGIAVASPGQATPDDVFREAEVALARAKSIGGSNYVVFQPEMSAEALERIELESDLRLALERDQLRLHYQPLVDLATDRIVGLEALVRWQHPERGLVPPLAFIPLAESTGLIGPIGKWVLETACRQARAWLDERPDAPLVMSVNLSARQFAQPDLVEQVTTVLAETGLPADRLELEITESVLMDESEAGASALRRLRELGVRLVLDDFGTGYSSLSYLRRLPLDTIKIDRSFVDGIDADDANLPIIQAVIALAHGLGIDVVAEGIETAGQLACLRELVCDRGQGYYYARPLPPADLTALLTAGVAPAG